LTVNLVSGNNYSPPADPIIPANNFQMVHEFIRLPQGFLRRHYQRERFINVINLSADLT